MTLRSLNEITGTLHKAARGAGLDDGRARDVAIAGARITADGGNGVQSVLDALDDLAALSEAIGMADLAATGETVRSDHPLFQALAIEGAAMHGAFETDDAAWDRALTLAHHTYVPASEASRLAGAGAGTTDND